MKEHLTSKAAEWFSDLDAWNAFIELAPLSVSIQDLWLDVGSRALRKHFHDRPSPGWDFTAWEGYIRDTWWFLEEFGQDSVGIGYGWKYHLCLGVKSGQRVDRAALTERLLSEDYRPLLDAFGRNDPNDFGFPLHQYGDFSFGTANDGNLSEHEIAWHAGHRTGAFVEQAAAKIEAFTRNPETTELMRRLNLELLGRGSGEGS